METLLHKSIVATVYDNEGECYGVLAEFDYHKGPESYIVTEINWQYLADVKPEADAALDDIKDAILINFPREKVDFELCR